ncbi:AMP-dependent synthetase/ligase [Paraliomyxa miuraensis]|uniref:AMP-dependent synthetase/ligase n=1 Tax=Paraliomyxa miuraensis TaxID=376150 RepID=UPI002250E12A|nr:long-chain fatty acid--CoA ligase [Paraliomyxa miuraensis]MCX4242799.1 long-chain fatty acid--CoA ligase [Paraliomyxa miuraensis]
MSKHETVADVFLHRVSESASEVAFQFPKGSGWDTLTWKQTGDRVRRISMGLQALGLRPEERCAILSTTRIEWILADLGILCAAGATTTVYPSNTPAECHFILDDSQTRFVFAEDAEQVAKLVEIRDRLPKLEKVIAFESAAKPKGAAADWVISLEDLEALGRGHDEANPEQYEATIEAIEPTHLATLIYTSGTTGQPKGVELLHECWVFTGDGVAEIGMLTKDDHQYLWLPLSHSFGKVLESTQLRIGFRTTIDGRIPKLVENLAVVQPTFMAAAPRIFEKVYNKVVTGAQASPVKWKIFRWALGVGRRASALRQKRQEPAGLLALQLRLADKLVFSKLRARFGGKIRFFISGSAPLSREMAEFFHAAGIIIYEGYGLTESSAASFVNRPDSFEFGSVGRPVSGVKVKIDPDNGEVLLGGRGIMRGYHNKPEATADALDGEGWLHTGDVGEMTAAGNLKITDRIKDLIKTSGGKYVAPQNLEGRLKAQCPYISQVIVHGNNRNFCTALITLDEESIGAWKAEQGLGDVPYAKLGEQAAVHQMLQEAVDRLNAELASYETIKKFAVLPKDLTVEGGELTASLKVKRKVVEKEYAEVLDGFYEGSIQKV